MNGSIIRERGKSLKKKPSQSELKFLKNQINPHFSSTHNNIYALALTKNDKTPKPY
ncbi:MAG: histidine kinase [Saprospiraceae bacterium]